MTERTLSIAGPAGPLEGQLHGPATAARAAAVLCHPHPRYGGDMDSHVVVALARALADGGVLALRFNFRGVGASAGSHDDGRGEIDDVHAACRALRAVAGEALPLIVAGYSFGAAVGLAAAVAGAHAAAGIGVSPTLGQRDFGFLARAGFPVLLVWGADDPYVSGEAAEAVARYPLVRTCVVPRADHFWWTGIEQVLEVVMAFVREIVPGLPAGGEARRG
jgi:alpha/beta superfamily hydrolase